MPDRAATAPGEAPPPHRERHLPCVDLEPGMILARPVKVCQRGVLSYSLGAGTVLTDNSIGQLLAHGAECACIVEADGRPESQRRAETERHMERLAAIFSHAEPTPATQALLAALQDYRRR